MDKTRESIKEIENELSSLIGNKPLTTEEFNRVQRNMTMQLPGMWETNSSVAGSVIEQVKFNLGDDYYKTYDSMVRKLTLDELQQLGNKIIKPDEVNFFVVGDKSKIFDSLKETGYEVIVVDADGNVVN
jgi:predicted Zn-dependent peptidase